MEEELGRKIRLAIGFATFGPIENYSARKIFKAVFSTRRNKKEISYPEPVYFSIR